MLRRPHNKEGPPVFSHEFVIQNHADIISCVCMVIFIGLIPQFSNQLASSVIFVQYNVTVEPNVSSSDYQTTRIDNKPLPETFYQHGPFDVLNVVFYAFVWIIIHALLQEYIWERTAKRLRLSKAKLAKYYDSGCLVVFFFLSLVWGINYIMKEDFLWEWNQLYTGYPHNLMTLSLKFYMLNQMAFWLHCYPELYFMKTKKDKIYSKIVLYTPSLLMIIAAYVVKLQRLALILLVLHYSVEFLFHLFRLLHYHGKDNLATPGFKLWRVLFVSVRVLTVVISILTLWFGLGKVHDQLKVFPSSEAVPTTTEGEGGEEGEGEQALVWELPEEVTHPRCRLCALGFILLLQLWVAWTFFSNQMERGGAVTGEVKPKLKTGKKKNQGDLKKNDKTAKAKTS